MYCKDNGQSKNLLSKSGTRHILMFYLLRERKVKVKTLSLTHTFKIRIK